MPDEFVQTRAREGLKVALHVGFGGLGPGAHGEGLVVVAVSGGAVVEDVGSSFVHARDNEANAVGPLPRPLRAELRLVGELADEAAQGHGGFVDVPVVEALVADAACEPRGDIIDI